MTGSKNSNRK